MILPHGPLWNRGGEPTVRVAENNGTGGAMMRMSRPQPVSLDKGLCRTGIRSHTAENDTLPYPCDAEVNLGLEERAHRSR